MKTDKLENVKTEMKRLDIEILGLCETRWADSGDFWSDDFKVICTNSTRRQAKAGDRRQLNSLSEKRRRSQPTGRHSFLGRECAGGVLHALRMVTQRINDTCGNDVA
ncbi:Hypothetical protein CINCED_3A025534 [Cinara cedri]|uniref:Uncharacterized protein n=1 Tax=Cinara cedri TaxID=506608 RepID=A0A5E4M5I2_9HEMI|nr:Hypothetical protein CINCED_3A025534 [Cinara cedri]